MRPEVVDVMSRVLTAPGNASSVHSEGRDARALVENARAEVAKLVGARPTEVVFTSGGTEADNLAIEGMIRSCGITRLIVSAIEHPAIMAPARRADVALEIVPVTAAGVIDMDTLRNTIKSGSDGGLLVSIILANNETGVIQPVAEIAALVHKAGGVIHTDATQAAGKIAVDFAGLGVDLLTLSAHKLAGPQGAGALIVRDGLEIAPLLAGGGQERGRRGGTENVAAIAGFGMAARLARENLRDFAALAAVRDRFEAALAGRWREAVVLGRSAARLPNTSCFAIVGATAERLLIALDLAGIAISSGAACSSSKVSLSPVLAAMAVEDDVAACALRMSLGCASGQDDTERLLAALEKVAGGHSARAETAAA